MRETLIYILYYFTSKLHSCPPFVNILQLILNVRQLWRHLRQILFDGGVQKKIIGR